jgi:hypothetical protein
MFGVVLSKVADLRDGPLHVFRSLDYDVIAADEDKHEAIRTFVANSEDYAGFLSDANGDATREDLQLASVILQRLLGGYEAAADRRARRLKIMRMLRRRGHDAARGWHHQPAALT